MFWRLLYSLTTHKQCCCQGLQTQGQGRGQGQGVKLQGQGQGLGPALIHTFLVGTEQEVMSLVVGTNIVVFVSRISNGLL